MAQTTFGRRNLPKLPRPPRRPNRNANSTAVADDLAVGIPGPARRWLVPTLVGLVLPIAALTAALATIGSAPAATEAAISLVAGVSTTTTKSATCKVSLVDFEKLRKGLTVTDAETQMGCPGIEAMQSNLTGTTDATYMWPIDGSLPGRMFAMFTDGRLVDRYYLTVRR